MRQRPGLLRAFMTLLYLGPLIAGLMGQGWEQVGLFALVFTLWSVILRPHLWPARPSELFRGEAVVAMAALIATQVLLVALCFGIGRGIGGVLGVEPKLPFYLPLAISVLSIPLSRLVWDPHAQAAAESFDPLLHRLQPETEASKADLAERMLAEVMALPRDTGEAVLQQHLTAIAAHLDPVLIRRGLGDAVADGKASRAGIKALIVHATDPAVGELLSGTAYPAQAFAAAGRDRELLALFAERCVMALEDEPDLASDCPLPANLLRAAEDLGDAPAAVALRRLAGLLEQGAKRDVTAPENRPA